MNNYRQNEWAKAYKPPKVSLATGEENTNKIGNFLKYMADRKNAQYQKDYVKMNMNMEDQKLDRIQNNNQFIAKLANSRYQDNQDRIQRRNIFNEGQNLKSQQFDRTMDFKIQSSKLKNMMTPYQKAQIKQNRIKDFSNGNFDSLLPTDVNDEIDRNGKSYNIAKQQYLENGTIPKFRKQSGWLDDDYVIDNATTGPQTSVKKENKNVYNEEEEFKAWKARRNNLNN